MTSLGACVAFAVTQHQCSVTDEMLLNYTQNAAPRGAPQGASPHVCLLPPVSQRHCVKQAREMRHVRCQSTMQDELQLLAGLTDINPVGLLLPGLGAVIAGAAALRFYLYSQLEVITAKMLSKYVPSGGTGARILQLGGGTRELYYYPKDVVLVTNVGEKVNEGLMQQAGVTAAVPTRVRQQPITDLGFQPSSSVDAVVALSVLSELQPQQQQQCLWEISRVLKPGMPLVFIEPLAGGGSPFRSLVGVSAGKQAVSTAQLESWRQNPAFSYVEWDTALAGQDPHAVGVAVRSERSVVAEDDEPSPGSRRRRKQPKAAKGFQ